MAVLTVDEARAVLHSQIGQINESIKRMRSGADPIHLFGDEWTAIQNSIPERLRNKLSVEMEQELEEQIGREVMSSRAAEQRAQRMETKAAPYRRAFEKALSDLRHLSERGVLTLGEHPTPGAMAPVAAVIERVRATMLARDSEQPEVTPDLNIPGVSGQKPVGPADRK